MAIEKIIDIKIQANAEQAVGSLRSQLRQAQADVATLSEKFGVTSVEATNAAKKAGELKDKIGDAKALTDAFNPDAKFKALSASLSGVAGGFAAVQGGMALLGVQSESVEKTLLKVQSAMALSQGLQAIGESVDSFRQLNAVIQSSTTFQKLNSLATTAAAAVQKIFTGAVNTTAVSFNALKTAIVSTGIGALVVGIGYLISKMNESADATEKLTKQQERFNAQLETTKKLTEDNAKAIDYNTQIALAKAKERGASEKELLRIQLDGYEERGKANNKEIETIQKTQTHQYNLTKDQNKRIQDLREQNQELQRQGNVAIANSEASAAQKRRDDALKNEKTKEEKLKELRDNYTKNLKNLDETQIVEELTNVDATNQAKRDKDQKFKEDTLAAQEQFHLQIAETIYDSDQAIHEREMALNEEKLQGKRDYYDAAMGLVQDGQDWMQKIEDAGIGRSKATIAIQKGLALVSLGIDTAKAFSTAVPMAIKAGEEAAKLAGPAAPLAGPIATAASYASSALMIIGNMNKARKLLGGGGGSGGTAPSMSSASAGGGGATAPQFNVVGNTGVNQLAATLGREQPPIKTYVTAGDVSSGQSLNRNIITNASLG
jgi:hypothetical protein